MLLDRPGALITREELHAKLWPQTIVDFDHGLNKAVSKIREALGDSAENPRFIETVARRGYRFLAEVAVVDDTQPDTVAGDLAAHGDPGRFHVIDADISPKRPSHALAWKLSGCGLALVLAGYLVWNLYPWGHALPAIHSLAVLPLKNLSGDASQDYFADGMTDALVALAQAATASDPVGTALGADGEERQITGNFWMEDDQADTSPAVTCPSSRRRSTGRRWPPTTPPPSLSPPATAPGGMSRAFTPGRGR